jgi:hypothetical protein
MVSKKNNNGFRVKKWDLRKIDVKNNKELF